MPIYQSTGALTGTIESGNVSLAQAYLTKDNMTQFLDESLKFKIERIRWQLDANGHDYVVEAFALYSLTNPELKELADWVSGQNSDGLGEGFEQQGFAETHSGYDYEDSGMISFDWETNDSTFVRVV